MVRSLARFALLALTASLAQAQIVVPGADGSDGPLNITANTEINLGLAAMAAWNTPSPVMGNGVYDASKWAVVFKYTDVTINAGTTVTFKNRGSLGALDGQNAPVVWLVSGNVTIKGSISLDGGNAGTVTAPAAAKPGPGGFASGLGRFNNLAVGSAGFGPGGGLHDPATSVYGGGSFGTLGGGNSGLIYGNFRLLPLVGGSGGSTALDDCGVARRGAAGGGAILIACAHSITFEPGSTIHSTGGLADGACGGDDYAGSGSGGGIRLVSDAVTGPGLLRAQGPATPSFGGDGRIRVEANLQSLTDPGVPAWTFGLPGPTAVLWPEDLSSSRYVRILSVAGNPVPADPRVGMNFGIEDVRVVAVANPTSVVLETMNVDTASPTVHVRLRVVRKNGADERFDAVFQGGGKPLATWVATLDLPPDITVLQGLVETP